MVQIARGKRDYAAQLREGDLMGLPRETLLPYQRKWVEDHSRAKFALQARQTGKDHENGCEVTETLLVNKTDWLIGAPSERQSLESLEKVALFAEAYQLVIDNVVEDREGGSETLLKSSEITFSNGSRCRAVPGKPNTVRGMSANVTLTEFAFFEQPDETWRAMLPSILNPMRGGEKKIRILTTPNGMGNKAHDIWDKGDGKKIKWSRHKVTLRDAIAQGLQVDYEEMAELMDDPEGAAQELDCEFLDTALVLLPYDVIIQCEAPEATFTAGREFFALSEREFPLFCGIDFARKRDLTVAWVCQKVGPILVTRHLEILRDMPTPRQFEILLPIAKACRRTCLDYNGAGVGLGDLLVEKLGEWHESDAARSGKVELCHLTNALNNEIFPRLRARMDERGLLIPQRREIREDLHSVYRMVTPNGNIAYRAPHTKTGHADRCVAAALCNRAASFGTAPFAYEAAAGGKRGTRAKRQRGIGALLG